MLYPFSKLQASTLLANDGHIGTVKDLYFDDQSWVVRYLVVDTGGWLRGRLVLISPVSLNLPGWRGEVVPTSLSKLQIERSPGIEENLPVSRQHEEELAKYYGWPAYWGERLMHGNDEALEAVTAREDAAPGETHDRRLRSAAEVRGYQIHARDGEIGTVTDFLLKAQTWEVFSLVVETGSWWSGQQVVVELSLVEAIDWSKQEVRVATDQETIRESPPYEPITAH